MLQARSQVPLTVWSSTLSSITLRTHVTSSQSLTVSQQVDLFQSKASTKGEGRVSEMPALSKPSEATFLGHSKLINAIGWSCDGKRLATASGDATARVWSVQSHREGKELELKDHTQSVDGVSWHPKNADVLATISTDKNLRIWDIRSKKSVAIATPDEAINVAYSPDGMHIAISDKNETVRLVDVRKNKIVANYALPPSFWVNEIGWEKNGDALLLAAGRMANLEKGLVSVVKVERDVKDAGVELKGLHSVVAAAANCMCIAIDPTNRHFATGSYDAISCIWDMEDFTCLRPCCTSLEEAIGALAFNCDGTLIAGVCDIESRSGTGLRKLVEISEVSTGESVYKKDAQAMPRKLAWHPSELVLAFGGEKLSEDRYGDNRSSRPEIPITILSFPNK